mgnify:FL=1
MSKFQEEIKEGTRFSFGKNWLNFLNTLSEERIQKAENSLVEFLEIKDLNNKSFLDVGCGSGLFSLAAKRLGASVYSFDYDPNSVAATRKLKHHFFGADKQWVIEEGSVLDKEYLKSIGEFDIVYSWGVLHHTGAMWDALENVDMNVKENGLLALALYNDQGRASVKITRIKKLYNKLPVPLNHIFATMFIARTELRPFLSRLIRFKPQVYFSDIKNYKEKRGMDWKTDKLDWIGGYPFEVSQPEEIFNFFKRKGYVLSALKTAGGGHGNNQYVFCKEKQIRNY